ncbi:TOM1-like protein 3 [Wolffia australiana]
MANGVACAERATSELLIGPDWAINMELCDIVNMDPGHAKEIMKTLKKRLGSKNPKIQILTLYVLETLSKNCGDSVHLQIVERDILHDMVKIVKKKPDLGVKEKILALIDEWQEAFGGSGGRYPQYHAAYRELRSAGIEFAPREENSVPLFTPPQTHPIIRPEPPTYEDVAIEASLQPEPPVLSLADIQNAHGIADVLIEMINAIEPNNSEELKQEVIVDLVEQCRSYQSRIMSTVNNTGDEQVLFRGLALNDDLQRVLQRYDELLKGKQPASELPAAPLVKVDSDDESDSDFSQLARRSSKENAAGLKAGPLLPPPPPPQTTVETVDPVDYLSGGMYRAQKSTDPTQETKPTSSSLVPPKFDDPVKKETSRETSLEVNPTSFLPPPPAQHNQREQFFKHGHSGGGGTAQEGSLAQQTHNLSINEGKSEGGSAPPTGRVAKPEDALFKDLLDFAKAKSHSPTKPTSKRTF